MIYFSYMNSLDYYKLFNVGVTLNHILHFRCPRTKKLTGFWYIKVKFIKIEYKYD